MNFCKICSKQDVLINEVCDTCHKISSNKEKVYKKQYNRKYREENPEKVLLSQLKRSDKLKSFSDNNLTLEFIKNSKINGCYYCGQFDNIGLDRIDNSLPHNQENVKPCCYRCNMFRGTCPYEAWLVIVPGIKKAYELGLFGDWKDKAISSSNRFESQDSDIDNTNCEICKISMKDTGNKTCSRKCATALSNLNRSNTGKVDWNRINLEVETQEKSLEQIGRELGVTGNTVKKRMKKLNIPLKPLQKDIDLLCKMCPNLHIKYSQYCGPECAKKDGGKPIINWDNIDLKEELKISTFAEIANKFGCTENAVRIRYKRFYK